MKGGIFEVHEPIAGPAPSTHAWITGDYFVEGNKITFNLPRHPPLGRPGVNTFTFSDNNKRFKLVFDYPGFTIKGVPTQYIITRN